MGILGDLFKGFEKMASETSRIIRDPAGVGKERAQKEFRSSSVADLVEGIIKEEKIVSENRAKAMDRSASSSDVMGAESTVAFHEAKKDELKKMLDEKLRKGS